MQVSILPNSPANPPPIIYDVDHMKLSLERISVNLNKIDAGTSSSLTTALIIESVCNIKDRVDLVDNANDFYKIGGFAVLPKLLSVSESQIQAASADLIAELVQNNVFCQNKLLETNIPEQLLNLLKETGNIPLCVKALYALSCLCRHNQEALIWFEKSGGLLTLLDILQMPVKSLQIKAAFFLSYLVTHEESIRNSLLNIDFVPKLINLIEKNDHAGQEYILSMLLVLVKVQNSSKVFRQKSSLKGLLENKIKLFGELPEYWESKNYCIDLLAECFNC